jgi:citrate synthase
MSAAEVYSPGLEGVIAGETAISTVTGGLRYRGYPVPELAENATYDEVAYLLLHGELPTSKLLASFRDRLARARELPSCLVTLFKALPSSTSPMDVLRSAVSVLAHFDPEVADNSHEANLHKAERLQAQIPVAVAAFYRLSHGQQPVAPRPDLSQAASLLYLIRGVEADPLQVKAFDVSMTLYAEHEFNASTFAARVVVSTESDLHSGVVAAVGALKGRLHGGANEKVMDILRQAGGPETAEKWLRDAFARKERIMGFGHRVYKTGDVRAGVLREYARQLAEVTGQMKWESTAAIIEKILEQEKNLLPNLDWPAGRLYHAMGLEVPLYTPIFVAARVAGWSAHIIEQLDHNRLIRPRARYTGPEVRTVKPIEERG